MVFNSDESIAHLFGMVLDEPAEEPSPIPSEIQQDMVQTERFLVGKGPDDKPPLIGKEGDYKVKNDLLNLDWVVS